MLTDLFPQLKALILDMDGVLWIGSEAIGDLPLTFSAINNLGLKVCLLTNNASKTRKEFEAKTRTFGLDLSADQIVSSATATMAYLQERFAPGSNIYVVGTPSLKKTTRDAGFHVVNHEPSPKADAVIVGLDLAFNYKKIDIASQLIRNGAAFILCNNDVTFPAPEGLKPGAGVMGAAIENCTGVKPIVIGKPSPRTYQAAFKALGCTPEETMGIGDRLDTDIAGAQAAGCLSGFVCSGVNTRADAETWQPKIDIIAKDLWSLLNA